MKKFLNIIIMLALTAGVFSCSNQDWEFDDFEYTTTYFPYQTPVRTLIIDDTYPIDNSNDLNLKFLVSAAMGGVYENSRDIQVEFVIDESLTNGLLNGNGDPVLPLPASYYTITNPNNTLVIPAGELSGGIEVQLSQAFLQDSMTVGVNYVLPVRIVSATTDSILSGSPIIENPDIRNFEHWQVQPKNFTLFGVKYVNKYHGTYLLRGTSQIKDANTGAMVDEVVYRQRNVTSDEIVKLPTIFEKSVFYSNNIRTSDGNLGNFEFYINFDDNGNGTIDDTDNSAFPVTGTAKFVAGGDEWGGKARNAIYLDYEIAVDDGTINQIHAVKDTLVFRDKGVVFEEFEYTFE